MQGIATFIPTETKINYLNALLRVGFDTLDFGSFVSPKAIPQMRDTAEVLTSLELANSRSRLLAIVANQRGAEQAAAYPAISYLGYPFSVSETFQLRNTNATIAESVERVTEIQALCRQTGKQLVIYISMGFGNPYGDPWNAEVVIRWVETLAQEGIGIFQLSDTIGVASSTSISYLFEQLIPRFPALEIGAHFHTTAATWREKVEAAYEHGCRRFDGAIRGYGGCPMARDELTGNMPMEQLFAFFDEKQEATGIDATAFLKAYLMAEHVFPGQGRH